MVLIGNAGQATSEGKSGLVETGLTGLAATALVCVCVCVCVLLSNRKLMIQSITLIQIHIQCMSSFWLVNGNAFNEISQYQQDTKMCICKGVQ